MNNRVISFSLRTFCCRVHKSSIKSQPFTITQFSTTPGATNINDELSNSNDSTNFAFDRKQKQLQKERAGASHQFYHNTTFSLGDADITSYDYFRTEIANRVVERLDDIVRENGFPLALDIGSGPGFIYQAICSDDGLDGIGGIGGVRKLVQLDSSPSMLHRDRDMKEGQRFISLEQEERCGTYHLVGDEEGPLPFPDGTFDLVLSSGALHWVNDLPGLLLDINRILKPDGCLIFAMVGGSSTLMELRSSLVLAEMEREGGVSTHVGPFIDFTDIGTLLSNAGFNLTTVDVDTIKLGYPNSMVLMEHLQRMGESNASCNRRPSISRETFLASACIYDDMFKLKSETSGIRSDTGDEGVETSVQVIYAIGWTPHKSQPKPKERGSATHKLGESMVEKSIAR